MGCALSILGGHAGWIHRVVRPAASEAPQATSGRGPCVKLDRWSGADKGSALLSNPPQEIHGGGDVADRVLQVPEVPKPREEYKFGARNVAC